MSTWRTPLWPAAGERGVLFDECERRGDRRLVRGEDLCGCRFVGERPQHRDALRWREREREAGDGALVVGIEATPERGTVAGIGAVAEEPFERQRVAPRAPRSRALPRRDRGTGPNARHPSRSSPRGPRAISST